MGYSGKLDLKLKAQQMRSNGCSYNEIASTLNIAKSSVSIWCKSIALTEEQILHLYQNKKTGSLKGSYIAAENKKKKTYELKKSLFEKGKNLVGDLSSRDRYLIGIALYAAEGTKTDKYCNFSNSDPSLIKFMVDWFIEFYNVNLDQMKGSIWLHEGLDENKAKEFWSKTTGIKMTNFYKTYIAENKINSKKIRKKKHEYGVFSFYIKNLLILRTIMGNIGGIMNISWYNNPNLTS